MSRTMKGRGCPADAVKAAAKDRGVPKNDVYQVMLKEDANA